MKYFTRIGTNAREFRFERRGDELLVHQNGTTRRVDVSMVGDGSAFSLIVDGRSYDVLVESADGAMLVSLQGERIRVEVEDERERVAHSLHASKASGKRELRAVMPGIVVAVNVKEGDLVTAGQTLLVLEAMKMQNPMQADAKGKVTRVHAKQGIVVAAGALLVEIDAGNGARDL